MKVAAHVVRMSMAPGPALPARAAVLPQLAHKNPAPQRSPAALAAGLFLYCALSGSLLSQQIFKVYTELTVASEAAFHIPSCPI